MIEPSRIDSASLRFLATTALTAPPLDGIEARAPLFDKLGWHIEMRGREESASLSLLAGGIPRILVTSDAEPARAASLGYSNEASLTLSWTPETLRLARTEIWRSLPGDTAVASVPADDEIAVRQLLAALARDRIGGLLRAPQDGELHQRLAEQLATAFARLRLQVSAAPAVTVVERDVFQLFHQLLFVRFHEDRFGPIDETGTLSEALAIDDPIAQLEQLLASYTDRFDSELFGDQVPVSTMPGEPMVQVVKAMVEPWERLRLNFSVTSSDVAGRLYQSFLASTPAVQHEGRLFPIAIPIDRQRERGAFYTPQPIAELLAIRTLSVVLREKAPRVPEDIRVLDPACGSGAFLLAAYRVLKRYFEGLSGGPLDENLRLDILTGSLFGGDDDETAIALTRIQLLEEAQVDKRRLPSLSGNIIPADLLKVDVTNVPNGWRKVVEGGGFDVILSNPPFHGPSGARRAGFDTVALRNRFSSARGTAWNIASAFVEAGLALVTDSGRLTMLVPQAVLDGPSGDALRSHVRHERLTDIVDFGRNDLFAPTMAYVAAVSLRGTDRTDAVTLTRVTATRLSTPELVEAVSGDDTYHRWPSPAFTFQSSAPLLAEAASWSPFAVRWRDFAQRFIACGLKWLGEPGAPEVAIGTQTGSDRKFVLNANRWAADGERIVVDNRYSVPKEFVPWWASGADLRPFGVGPLSKRVVVPKTGEDPDVDDLIEHLGGVPSSFFPGHLAALRGPKVIVRGLFDEPAAVADPIGDLMIPQGGAGAFAVVTPRTSDIPLLEALLNSALYQWLLQGLGHSKARGYVQLMRHHWHRVPWPILAQDGRAQIIAMGKQVRRTLTASGADRPSRYWSARVQLDVAVYEALGVDEFVQDTVSAELWRRP